MEELARILKLLYEGKWFKITDIMYQLSISKSRLLIKELCKDGKNHSFEINNVKKGYCLEIKDFSKFKNYYSDMNDINKMNILNKQYRVFFILYLLCQSIKQIYDFARNC